MASIIILIPSIRTAAAAAFFLCLATGCAATGETRTTNRPELRPIESVASEQLTGTIEYAYNADSSYVLCSTRSKPTTERPLQSVRFVVVRVADRTVVHEDDVPDGSVRWIDGDRIRVKRQPGIITTIESDNAAHSGYDFDVRKGVRVKP